MYKRLGPGDIPVPVLELCQTLTRHGFRGWVVGGCIRDLLRGQQPADWDLATDAAPQRVQAIFPRVIPTGIQHGTVTVRHRGASYEVTTLRGEGAYSDGRRPDSVQFVTEITEDLSRRDFTVNALAYDPVAERLEDPFAGLADLERGVIRAVGEPARRFGEDGLRVLRAARFAATLEFAIDPATEAAIRPTLPTFRRVSAERVRDEWLKALKARAPSRAFEVLRRTGVLEVTAPELASVAEEVWSATMTALDGCRSDPCLRISVLLWPLRAELDQVDAWLVRYRFSNAERERILRVLRWAAPSGCAAWGASDVRRYARDVGRAFFTEVAEMGALLAAAHDGRGSASARAASALSERLASEVSPETPLSARDLALGGRELMVELGVPPGPQVGKLLEALVARALEQPSINTRERLLELARTLVQQE